MINKREYYKNKFIHIRKGENNSEILQNPNEPLSIMGFSGRKTKPDFYFAFHNETEMNKYIENYLKGQIEKIIRESKKNGEFAKRKEDNKSKYIPGMIVYSSWGYDQTNVDFYKVVKTSPSGSTLYVIEVGDKIISAGNCRDYGTAEPDESYEGKDIISCRVSKSGFFLKDGYNLKIYEGKPVYCSWGR